MANIKKSDKLDTVERVMAVLSYLSSSGVPIRLTEIAKQFRLSKASTLRILRSLEKGGWVECDANTGLYRISYKFLGIGLSLLSNSPIIGVSMRYLTNLRDVTGETVSLCVRAGTERIFLQEVQSNRELRFNTPLGKRIPLWLGSGGKAILAHLSEEDITTVLKELSRPKSKLASGKIPDVVKIRKDLELIRKQGYAISIAEREPGVSAVAAPIFNHINEVIGSVSIAGPSERFSKSVLKKYGPLIKESTDSISQQIGTAISLQLVSSGL